MSDQGSQGKLSPYLQKKRIAAVRPHLKGRIIDIGCGNGALASLLQEGNYFGLDRSEEALKVARSRYPDHTFASEFPAPAPEFDTVASLAVIEHIPDPRKAIISWSAYMKPAGQMVLTTPHPAFEWAHEAGARIGIFSHDAAEEHEEMIDRLKMEQLLKGLSLRVSAYRRFLFGVNQLFVITRG